MKVLVVEDTEDSRILLEMVLQSEGYEVTSCVNGIEALSLAYSTHPDLIISDIMMPEMDGFELCRKIKVDPELKKIPLIFYTATYTDRQDEELAMALGASRYVIKPMEPQALMLIIKEILAEFHQGELPVPQSLQKKEHEIDEMHLHTVGRKLDEKIRMLEQEQKALKKSEERYRHLVESIQNYYFFYTQDINGQFTYLSPSIERLLGYKPDEFLTHYSRYLTKHPANQNVIYHTEQSVKGIEQPPYELEIVAKNGSLHWLEVKENPVFDQQGKVWKIEGIAHDITERKRAEEKLKKNEKQLAQAQQIAHLGNWELDLVSNELNWSDEIYRIFEIDADIFEPNFQLFIDTIHPDDREFVDKAYIDSIRNKTAYNIEHRLLLKDGRVKYVNERCETSYDNNNKPIRSFGTVLDITERKELEAQLRKLAQVVEQSPESIIITNLNAEIEYVNEAFVRSTGYTRDEVIGKNPRILSSGKTSPENYQAMWDTLNQGQAWKGEFHNKRKDGNEYFVYALVTPIHQLNDSISHYVAVTEDITNKKNLQIELDDHRHHLEDLVEERTSQLAEAQEKAETANQAKSLFLANMSHEIRTPMNAIIGLTHLLQRADPRPEQSERLTKITAAAGHLLSIINDILDLSKIEAGKMILEQSNFHMDALFDHIKSLLSEQVAHKGLTFKVDLNGAPAWLKGDSTRLRQALLNYASNAIKFTEHGTITMRVKILDEQGDDFVLRFEVEDTGIGIKPEILPGLFSAFEQADPSTTRYFGGTGLGLAITRRFAQLMGGEAGAESEPGQGSTFWFTARLSRGHDILQDEPSSEQIDVEMELCTYYSGSRILLVEDNPINREVALELLNSVGLSMTTAENGREAVELVRDKAYDLILMDVQMPEMDGLEATQIIRSMDGYADMPILAMTANVFEEDRQACLKAGMNDFVAKPVDPENLFLTVSKWLPKRTISTPSTSPSPVSSTRTTRHENTLLSQLSVVEGIDVNAGLRNMGGDSTAYLRLLRLFDTIHGHDMHKLKVFLAEGKTEDAHRIVHSFKGAAGTMGLIQLQNISIALAEELRNNAGNEVTDEINSLINEIITKQNYFHHALTQIAELDKFEDKQEREQTDIQESIDRLKKLLAMDDTAANVLFSKSETQLKQTYGAVVEDLRHHIEAFDYPRALKTLKSMSP